MTSPVPAVSSDITDRCTQNCKSLAWLCRGRNGSLHTGIRCPVMNTWGSRCAKHAWTLLMTGLWTGEFSLFLWRWGPNHTPAQQPVQGGSHHLHPLVSHWESCGTQGSRAENLAVRSREYFSLSQELRLTWHSMSLTHCLRWSAGWRSSYLAIILSWSGFGNFELILWLLLFCHGVLS